MLEKSKIDFISPQVDNTLQGILAKAPVHFGREMLRNSQLVKARVVWNTAADGGGSGAGGDAAGRAEFVFVAKQQNGAFVATQTPVTLGDTVGNTYSVTSGLNPGDKVIVSSTQFLVNNMPVQPMGA